MARLATKVAGWQVMVFFEPWDWLSLAFPFSALGVIHLQGGGPSVVGRGSPPVFSERHDFTCWAAAGSTLDAFAIGKEPVQLAIPFAFWL